VFTMSKNFSRDDREKCFPIVWQMMDLAFLTRDEGVLALEAKTDDPDIDPLLSVAISLITEGVDPVIVKAFLENILQTEQYEGYELLKSTIIIEGALSIQAGEIPKLIGIKLASYLGLEYVTKVKAESERRDNEALERLYASLQKSHAESEAFEKMILELDKHEIKEILRAVNTDELSSALKACGGEIVKKVMECVPRGLVSMLWGRLQVNQLDIAASVNAQNKMMAVYEER